MGSAHGMGSLGMQGRWGGWRIRGINDKNLEQVIEKKASFGTKASHWWVSLYMAQRVTVNAGEKAPPKTARSRPTQRAAATAHVWPISTRLRPRPNPFLSARPHPTTPPALSLRQAFNRPPPPPHLSHSLFPLPFLPVPSSIPLPFPSPPPFPIPFHPLLRPPPHVSNPTISLKPPPIHLASALSQRLHSIYSPSHSTHKQHTHPSHTFPSTVTPGPVRG